MARMTVMSIALLQVERCSARVATPSETVKDKEPIRLPSCLHASLLIMPPANPHRKAAFDRGLIVGLLTAGGGGRRRSAVAPRPLIPHHSRVKNRALPIRSSMMSLLCGRTGALFIWRSAMLLALA